MPLSKVAAILISIAKEMEARFSASRQAFEHPGLKGSSAEDILKDFFRKYLPENLDITSGTVIDSYGNTSKQLDIIICDKHNTPIFFESEEKRLIPVENVYAIIEVKSKLAVSQIKSIIENMLSVKKLKKEAFFPEGGVIQRYVNLYEKTFTYYPVNYFVFSFDSEDIFRIGEVFNDEMSFLELSVEERVDCVCVLNQCVIYNNRQDGKMDALPSNGSVLYVYPTPNSLSMFFVMISHYLFQTMPVKIRLVDYMKGMTW